MANLHPGAPQQKPSPDSLFYQFSPEETRVMNECNSESFFQRSLPLSLITGAVSYAAVNAGYLKKSLKWGPWPKAIFGGLFGYLIGKYSYQAKCAEKLMQLPNSELGRVLRERRGKTSGEFFQGNAISPTNVTPGNDVPTLMTDYKSDIDIDMHKPINSLDTDYRPNYDGLPLRKDNELSLSNVTPTSYEDLRNRNRQDYDRTQPNKPTYRPPPPSNTQPIWDNQAYPPSNTQPIWNNQAYPASDQTRTPQSRNQYGDVV
ncbi:OCIA domain-containing protein 1 [Rhopalosiphum maidis]|uniref:OCIA domain-containing protein 1 n=1 Tax=Rhopalosiphum maidis TaxID=43146 RepID=UPI000EFE6231|nr:OCIA domain-containing protein 1 [Rhopalosiphum maidis]